MTRTLICAGLVVLTAAPASAQKITSEFKTTFERTFRPRRTIAVMVHDKVPTVSVYGPKGDQSEGTAHFSVDVKDGVWQASQGIMDFYQETSDSLTRGELVELNSINYRDNRIDLRVVSVEGHRLFRPGFFGSGQKREAVATNFKFFLPFPRGRDLTATDVPEALAYIARYLRPFESEDAARAFAASLVAGAVPADPPARAVASEPAAPPPTRPARKEIKVGMTFQEVEAILGRPQDEVTFEKTTRWTYAAMTVIFEDGRVKEVRF